jgi:hypothetical protein
MMERVKDILITIGSVIFWLMAVTGLLWLLAGGSAMAKDYTPDNAFVGQQAVELLQPDGLVKVNGMCPEADEFIESLKEIFKLNVLAVYANPDQWKLFVNGLVKKQPSMVPSLAVISSTTRGETKSYDRKGVAKELRHLNNMVQLAINTKPLSVIMSNRANAKLRTKLGKDLGFSYALGKDVGRYAEDDRSISFSLMTSLKLYGLRTDSFVTASALNIGDKFIYLTWFDPDRSQAGIEQLKAKSVAWLGEMAKLNK